MLDLNARNLIIAHRGESFDAPENTLASVKLAWKKNADAVEIDIRMTKDNQIVVIHDSNIKRIWGQNKTVKNSTLSELKQINILNSGYPNEKIPTLKEIYATVPANKKLIVEIKTGSEIIPFLKSETEISGLNNDQIEFISFNFDTVSNIKKEMPQYKMLWIRQLKNYLFHKIFPFKIDEIIKRAKDCSLDGFDLYAGKIIKPEFVDKIKSSGLSVYLWTVNEPKKAKMFFDMGIDAITTDRAQWMKEQLTNQL